MAEIFISFFPAQESREFAGNGAVLRSDGRDSHSLQSRRAEEHLTKQPRARAGV